MSTEEIALSETEKQLRQRGFATTRTGRNGDIDARKGPKLGRLEVKGLALPNGVWLTKGQVNAVHAVVIYVVQSADVWVLSLPPKRISCSTKIKGTSFHDTVAHQPNRVLTGAS